LLHEDVLSASQAKVDRQKPQPGVAMQPPQPAVDAKRSPDAVSLLLKAAQRLACAWSA